MRRNIASGTLSVSLDLTRINPSWHRDSVTSRSRRGWGLFLLRDFLPSFRSPQHFLSETASDTMTGGWKHLRAVCSTRWATCQVFPFEMTKVTGIHLTCIKYEKYIVRWQAWGWGWGWGVLLRLGYGQLFQYLFPWKNQVLNQRGRKNRESKQWRSLQSNAHDFPTSCDWNEGKTPILNLKASIPVPFPLHCKQSPYDYIARGRRVRVTVSRVRVRVRARKMTVRISLLNSVCAYLIPSRVFHFLPHLR